MARSWRGATYASAQFYEGKEGKTKAKGKSELARHRAEEKRKRKSFYSDWGKGEIFSDASRGKKKNGN